jgi:trimeric autotransporter adhesin
VTNKHRRLNLARRLLAITLLPCGLLVASLTPAQAGAAPGTISTVAGGPGRGLATEVAQSADSVATGPGGAVYVGDAIGVVREFTNASAWEKVVAGGGSGAAGNGGPATGASLASVDGLAVQPGQFLVTSDDSNQVQVVPAVSGTFFSQAMTAGHIYAIAGTGTAGYSGDGGPGPAAELDQPAEVALDSAGNLLIADRENNRIRVVAGSTGTFYGQAMTSGDIYTIAGNGTFGFSGDGGPATAAELAWPTGLAVDAAGNVLLADSHNFRIRVVAASTGTFYGQAMTAGDIYTIAGDGVSGFSGDGGPATSAELGGGPLAVDSSGNVLFGDIINNRVRVVAASTATFYGQAMTAGDIYTIAGDGIRGYSGDHGPATSAKLGQIGGLAFDSSGNLVIGDNESDMRVRLLATSTGTFYRHAMTAGDIYTIAGNGQASSGAGGPALNAELSGPNGPIVQDGPTSVATSNCGILTLANNRVWDIPAASGSCYGQTMVAGDIYTIAGDGKASATSGALATGVSLDSPASIAVDQSGNLLIAEFYGSEVQVVARSTGTFYGQAMTIGDIYTIAGTGTFGYSGNGGPATAAELGNPYGVAVDSQGNVLISDDGPGIYRVRMVAEETGTFYGQAMTAGDIYTIAGDGTEGFSGDGGPATAAELGLMGDVAVDGAGNLLIADESNGRIRLVAGQTGTFYGLAVTAGDIYTVAGGGPLRRSDGDGGPATMARLGSPWGVAVDASGNILIADAGGDRIRAVAGTSGSYYGQAMTAGDIYTVAGNGKSGFRGDGGPATTARLNSPWAVAVDAAGDLIIADAGNGRVRSVSW